jgi:hypothetical protein
MNTVYTFFSPGNLISIDEDKELFQMHSPQPMEVRSARSSFQPPWLLAVL